MKWLATLCKVKMSLFHLVLHFLFLKLGRTALHLASKSGHDKVFQVLLQALADVDTTDEVSTTIFILITLVTLQKLKI